MKSSKVALFVRKVSSDGIDKTLIIGIALTDLMQGSEEDQMWLCDLVQMEDDVSGHMVLLPSLILEGSDRFDAYTPDDLLQSLFTDPQYWKRILLNRTGEDIEVGG